MSFWTHIMGVINVSPYGRTQHEMTYIINTVLDHLPQVTGSEGDMGIFVNINPHDNISSSHDEFFMMTNNLKDHYGACSREHGFLRMSDDYYLTIYGDLRDRMFSQTFREFQRWLCRLSKRLMVNQINVTITADDRREPYNLIKTWKDNPYYGMFESPSWSSWDNPENEPAWYEYLLWEPDPYTRMPISHVYKYISSDSVDKEMERRRKWRDKRDED